MPSPTFPIEAIWLTYAQRFDKFAEYARYMPDAPLNREYHIRVSGALLTAGDTHDLHVKFEAWVRKARWGRKKVA